MAPDESARTAAADTSAERPGETERRRPRPAREQPPPIVANPASISGTVLRDGQPVPGATVTARSDAQYLQAVTDTLGAFRLEQLSAGQFLLSANTDAAASEVIGPFVMAPGQRQEGVVLTLHAAASLTGTVRDERTRRPIEGAQVRSSSGATVTDHAGRFTLASLPAPGSWLEASAEGYETRAQWLTLDGAREHGGMELSLRASTILRGRVTRLGQPVAGASVWAEGGYLAVKGEHFGPVATDADGRFALDVAAGELQLAASGPGQGRVAGPQLTVSEGGRYEELHIELGEALEARGTVTVDGQPAEGVSLFLIDARSQQVASGTATGPGGAFTLTGVPTGAYLVQVHAGAQVAQRGPFTLTGSSDEPWNIELSSERKLGGRVEPAQAGVVVRWWTTEWAGPLQAQVATDAEGRFAFEAVPEGALHVEAEGPAGYATAVATAGTEVLLRLRQSEIRGVVVDERGRAATDFTVSATPRTGGLARSKLVLHPNGEFALSAPPGHYEVSAQVAGRGQTNATLVEVPAGGAPPEVRLQLIEARAVSGFVVDARTDAALGGVEIAIVRIRANEAFQHERGAMVTSDAAGRFDFGAVPNDARIRFRRDGYRTAWVSTQQLESWGGRVALTEGTDRRPPPQPYEGVGMVLRPEANGTVFVQAVFEGGPAQAAGVLRNDEIVAVDGRPVAGRPLQEVTQLIMGPSGSVVRVTFRRGDQVFQVALRRRSIRL